MGGVSAVVNIYRRAGLFGRFPIHYLATHRDGSAFDKLSLFAKAWFSFVWLLLSRQVKLVHVHGASRASFWRKLSFLLLAYTFHVPVIFHLHGASFDKFYEKNCGTFGKWLVRLVLDRAAALVVLSEQWRTWIQKISSNRNVHVINNPIELVDTLANIDGANHTILCLGRLGKRKGTYDLLDAVARLVPRYPALTLMLGGDGELAEVGKRAEELGIAGNVRILGWVSGGDKARLLEQASIYTLPSYAEGLPVSVLEAMSAGLPIVSTPVGGIPEAVGNGVEGLLVTPGDIDALASAFDQLLSDAALRKRIGDAARKKVESSFATTHVLPQLESLYRELGDHRVVA